MEEINKNTIIKDIAERNVKSGEAVGLLNKHYGFRKISSVSLEIAVYLGYNKTTRCHIFRCIREGYTTVVSKRSPEIIKLSKKDLPTVNSIKKENCYE